MSSRSRGGRRLVAAVLTLPLVIVAGLGLGFAPCAAETPKPRESKPAELGRTPWTTSRVVGSPDPPPPFKVVRAFPNLKFEHPLLIARCPGSDRLFVGEQAGVLYSFADKPGRQGRPLLRPAQGDQDDSPARRRRRRSRRSTGWRSTRTSRRTASASSATPCASKNRRQRNLADGTRVSRFTVTKTDPPRIDPASEEIVLTFLQGGHNGGDIHFGPDGMLYISTGDAANPNPPDPFNTGQDISDLLSSILRIDVDHKDEGQELRRPEGQPVRRR